MYILIILFLGKPQNLTTITLIMKGRYLKQLNTFLESSLPFELIYSTSPNGFVLPLTNRINVLDSSFNPPHKGHFSLVKSSILQNYNQTNTGTNSFQTINDKSVLLLLSVKNADKGMQLASFSDRLDMMHVFANVIYEQLGICVSIGLTKHAFFADKSHSILQYLLQTYQRSNIKLTFLMGYDTLIRVFNPKYYAPVKISEALGEFMDHDDLLVLTRDDEQISEAEQFEYLNGIKNGKSNSQVPSQWADKIFMVKGEDESLKISSSSIRKLINEGDLGEWDKLTFPGVVEYIKANKPYSE